MTQILRNQGTSYKYFSVKEVILLKSFDFNMQRELLRFTLRNIVKIYGINKPQTSANLVFT